MRGHDVSGATARARLCVIPRIKTTSASGQVGSTLRVYFYGFAPAERVEIRWALGSEANYAVIKTVRIASNGRASTVIEVPEGSPAGKHKLTGKVVGVSRSASTVFTVIAETPTPTVEPTATATNVPSSIATATSEQSETTVYVEEPTATATPLEEQTPTSTPAPSVTEVATLEPTPTPEPTDGPTASPPVIDGE